MTLASVVTGKGVGAIAVVELAGCGASEVIAAIFRGGSGRAVDFSVGDIHTGNIVDGDRLIDNVVVARKGDDQFAINCHGNPLIVEAIMEVLKSKDVKLVDAEVLVAGVYAEGARDSIEVEAKVEQLKAVSLAGVRLIDNQIEFGLGRWARGLLESEELCVEALQRECQEVLEATKLGGYLIKGAKVVIAGAPNCGKSTLLNFFAGKEKAIVADIAGTTRDWVSISCRIGEVAVEVFDTAGLDEGLAGGDELDGISQKAAHEIIEQADVVIYMYDGAGRFDRSGLRWLEKGRVVIAANKCDMLSEEQTAGIDDEHVRVCADSGQGVQKLCERVLGELAVDEFDRKQAVCFTERQAGLVGELLRVEDSEKAKSLITELLNGDVFV